MGREHRAWQEADGIMRLLGNRQGLARQLYRQFVEQGIAKGSRHELSGGGLIRSAGGWEALKQKGQEGQYHRSDERILGDSDFVDGVLDKSKESMTKRQILKTKGMGVDKIAARVSELLGLPADDVWAAGKQQPIVNARSLLCY